MNDQSSDPQIKVLKNEMREAAMLIPVKSTGVAPMDFAQQVDLAKWMATAGFAVNKDLRNNIGACIAVYDMSQRWGFAPYQVARMVYQVNGTMAFESQLIHAVIEKFAPLKQRMRCSYEGEGDKRVCIVTAHVKGEVDPIEYQSPQIGNIKPQNSPLWKTDPDQQLWYYSSRACCRKFFPDILMGIYGRDEIEDNPHIGAANAIDISPPAAGLHERLAASQTESSEGFREGVVEAGLAQDGPGEAAGAPEPDSKGKKRGKGKATQEAPKPYAMEMAEALRKSADHPAAEIVEKSAGAETKTPEAASRAQPYTEKAEPPKVSMGSTIPKTEKQYRAWVVEWLPSFDNEDDINERWDAERKLRNACGLTEETRKPIYDLVRARIAEVAR